MVFLPCCTGDGADVLNSNDAAGNHNRALDRLPAPAEFEPTKARLAAMIIVGHTTPTTAKIWVRVPEAGPWTVVLRAGRPFAIGGDEEETTGKITSSAQTHEFGKDQASTALTSSTERLLNHCFEFTALEPDTRYYYALVRGTDNASSQGIAVPEGPRPLLHVLDQQDPNHEQCYFRTARTTGGITFAAYSCHDPYSWARGRAVEGAWPQLAQLARSDVLDLTIGGGDQVYVDSNEIAMTDLWIYLRENRHHLKQMFVANDNQIKEKELTAYLTQLIREYYLIYWNFPNLRAVHSRVPAYMMWDDHEIMDGWGSVDRRERIVKLKKKTQLREEARDDALIERMVEMTFQAASAVYSEFQHSHNPGRSYRPGTDDPRTFAWDYTWSRGECHFFALDMRGGHNCDAKCDRLLGTAQHDRLRLWLEGLEAAGAQSAFVVAPVPVVHWSTITEHAQLFIPSLKDDLMDGWGHPTNHVERAKLLKALFAASDRLKIPITIVSGDVHCASCYTLKDTENYPNARIVQVTSSSISRKPCGSVATMAYAPNGRMQERLDDGRGKIVKTSIYQKQVFAKAGVNNFVVISARGGNIDITFYWPAKDGKGAESAKVDLTK